MSDIHANMADKDETQTYLSDRQIPELFQTLMVGIVLNQPADPTQYLIDCLDHVREVGMNRVYWDAFVPQSSITSGVNQTRAHAPRDQPPEKSHSHNDVTTESPNEVSLTVGNKIENEHDSDPEQESLIGRTITDQDERSDHAENHTKMAANERRRGKKEKRAGGTQSKNKHRHNQERNTVFITDPDDVSPKQDHDEQERQEPNQRSWHLQSDPRMIRRRERRVSDADTDGVDYLRRPHVMEVLGGSMHDLPQIPSNTVRIFLSSTFSDFKAERNILPRLAYPRLQRFCSDLGLDFQVVDMRWGVTDELMNDHQVSELCIKEIKACQQVSCGPSFVTMLGDRYGYRPFPAKITCNEYDLLTAIAEKEQLAGRTVINDWYKRDDNAIPAEYILQPIASRLAHYYDTEEKYQTKRKEDRQSWQEVSQTILRVLRICAQHAKVEGSLPETQADKYFISVTEDEIRTGVLDLDDTKDKALCFHRHLQDVEKDDKSAKRWRFVDLVDNETLDEEAKEYRIKLIDSRLRAKINTSSQLRKYQLRWRGTPIEESDQEEYNTYLKQFADDFVTGLTCMISHNQAAEARGTEQLYKELYEEALYHARFAKMKCELFCGRQDTLDILHQYVSSSTPRPPLIISGRSGYGKTALLAFSAKSISELVPSGNSNVIMRFMGTSPQSSNILVLLRSIIHHICALYAWNVPSDEKLSKMGESRRYFKLLLTRIYEQQPTRKLVIMLDSVDQLSKAFNAHSMTWLPKVLPHNVYVVVTMLSDRFECLQHSMVRFPDHSFFHELVPLSTDNGLEIISTFMSSCHRTLTSEQRNLVCTSFQRVSQPLFLKLVLDRAAKWYSYDPLHLYHVPSSAHDAIIGLFETLEVTYGKVFVARALGYLSSGHGGLSGLELEDVLSCDDDVLNEVYKYHDPPLPGTIRLPSLMWVRVEDDLKEYLAHRQMDGKTVMTWYHRQFWEAAEYRYLADVTLRRFYHKQLAELYQQEGGIQRTILLHQRGGKIITDADRRVTPQPFRVSNLRKLNCLPYHLVESGDIARLKDICLLSFTFLYKKLQAVGIISLLYEYNELNNFHEVPDPDIIMVNDFLELSQDSLRFDATLFAYNIIDRIGCLTDLSTHLKMFLQDAKSWIVDTTTGFCLPTHPIQELGLNSSLKFSVMCGQDGVMASNETTIICSWSDKNTNISKFQSLNLNTKDIMTTVSVSKLSPVVVTKDSKYFIYVDHMCVQVADVETGDISHQLKYTKHDYNLVTPRCVAISGNGLFLAIGVRLEKPTAIDENVNSISCIALLSLQYPDQPVVEVNFWRQKHIDKLLFVNEDTELLAFTKSKILKFSIPSLEMVHTFDKVHGMYSNIYAHVPEESSVLVTSSHSKGIQAMYYNYNDNTYILSKPIGIDADGDNALSFPCGVASLGSSHISVVTIAVQSTEVRKSKLFLWDITNNTFEGYVVGLDLWKIVSCLKVRKSWDFAFIGWRNGDISVFDLHLKEELLCIHAHGAVLNDLIFYHEDTLLVSFGQDHFLKVWDVNHMIGNAKRADVSADTDADHREIAWDNPEGLPPGHRRFCREEQCLWVDVTSQHVISAPHFNVVSPKFWNLDDGYLDQRLSKVHNIKYAKSLEERCITFAGRTHGEVKIYNTLIIYSRKKRDEQWLWVSKGLESPDIISHEHIREVFFFLVPATEPMKSLHRDADDRQIILVKDGTLEVRDIYLKMLYHIPIPRITDEVNIHSNNGKRKLIYYKICMTFDGKYFIIANPVAKGKQMFIDLIDMEKRQYDQRINMDARVHWNIVNDSFYYLMWRKGSAKCEILTPSRFHGILDYDYKCLLFSTYSFLSEDLSMGVEYCRCHSIRLWRTNPLESLHVLRGHESDLSRVCFSADNRFLASGSFDQTIRLWSTESGQQVALFHVYGAVDDVHMTPNVSHLIVHCYSAPQRKSVVILKTHNIV